MNMESTIYVVDDDRAVRDSLHWLFESVNMLVQSFDSCQPFLDMIESSIERIRGCLLVDVRLPGMTGLELQTRLRSMGVTLPVIVITGHADVTMAVRAMKAGAVDFIEKPFDGQFLLDRIRQALVEHRRGVELDAVRCLLDRRKARLTTRERQVMRMVVNGALNKQIAHELDVSPKTVEVHRANMMVKMQAQSLADLVRMAVILDGDLISGVATPEKVEA